MPDHANGPAVLLAHNAPGDWARLAAAEGAKEPRFYYCARARRPWTSEKGFEHWLLVRRKRSNANEKAYYLAFAPPGATLAELAAVAGLRWAIKECFECAKGELGLDHCEARSWHGWHRHMSLCMAALAFLAKLSADLRRSAWSKPNGTSPPSQWPPDPHGHSRAERYQNPLSARPHPDPAAHPQTLGRYGDDNIRSTPPSATTNTMMRNCSTSRPTEVRPLAPVRRLGR